MGQSFLEDITLSNYLLGVRTLQMKVSRISAKVSKDLALYNSLRLISPCKELLKARFVDLLIGVEKSQISLWEVSVKA